jgi:hypothetical protein
MGTEDTLKRLGKLHTGRSKKKKPTNKKSKKKKKKIHNTENSKHDDVPNSMWTCQLCIR